LYSGNIPQGQPAGGGGGGAGGAVASGSGLSRQMQMSITGSGINPHSDGVHEDLVEQHNHTYDRVDEFVPTSHWGELVHCDVTVYTT